MSCRKLFKIHLPTNARNLMERAGWFVLRKVRLANITKSDYSIFESLSGDTCLAGDDAWFQHVALFNYRCYFDLTGLHFVGFKDWDFCFVIEVKIPFGFHKIKISTSIIHLHRLIVSRICKLGKLWRSDSTQNII